MWRVFWAEALTPSSRSESPWLWAVIAAGHTLIGLAAAVSLGWLLHPLVAPAVLAGAYAVLKEARDARHGGRRRDGLDAGPAGLTIRAAPPAAPSTPTIPRKGQDMTPSQALKGSYRVVTTFTTDNGQVLVVGYQAEGRMDMASCATFDTEAEADRYAAFLRRDPAVAPAPAPAQDPAPAPGEATAAAP